MSETAIRWTALEAMACAYCWAEFTAPETRKGTPEAYWRSITEKARESCRDVARRWMLVEAARGSAVVLPLVDDIPRDRFEHLKANIGIGSDCRAKRVLRGVDAAMRMQRA